MKKLFRFSLLVLMAWGIAVTGSAQIKDLGLKKAKGKLKGLLEEATSSGEDKKEDNSSESSNSPGSKSLNTRMTPGEVMETLDAARSSYNSQSYGSARYSIQQALVEIELQLGEKVLDEMPKTVRGQAYEPESDMAVSTGVGFIGLNIAREYPSSAGDIKATIANNSAMLAPYSMALSNPQMISQDENMKSVTVDGRRGILELDGDSFRLVLPFGQSSIFLLECGSCPDEASVKGLAGEFDLDAYLKILGEAPVNTAK